MKNIIVSLEELESKQLEIEQKLLSYQAAQQNQLNNGGPGPVADYYIMEIANEHDGQFMLIVEQNESVE